MCACSAVVPLCACACACEAAEEAARCRAGFQMLVALIVIAISLARMMPAPAWLGWYTLAFILLFDSAYAWSCERSLRCSASYKQQLILPFEPAICKCRPVRSRHVRHCSSKL